MKRGRKPKPVALHIVDGTFNTTRHSDKLQAVGSELIKPNDLTEYESQTWDLVVSSFPGTLATIDAVELRHYCYLTERLDQLRKAGKADPTDLSITRAMLSVGVEMRRMGDGFGMNPSARQNMKQPDTTETNELSEFIG